MKRIPDASSREYKPFFKNELHKIKHGITINGVQLGGWLYWHTNHWKIFIDRSDGSRKLSRPWIRDNEWIIDGGVQNAEKNKRGLLILGSRQFGKSEVGASYEGRRTIAYKNTQNVLAGLSSDDLQGLLSKLYNGYNHLHPYFKPILIKNDSDKQIILGYRTPQEEKVPYSEILIKNLWKGKKTEAVAGPTASSLILDEIGKGSFLEALIAALPAIQTPYGWRCSPIFTGTSGSFDDSEDLQRFRDHLDTYKFDEIELNDSKEGKIYYFPGYLASRAERKILRLSDYLEIPRGSELDKVPIHVVADIEKERVRIKEEVDALDAAGEHTLSKKQRMYYPLTEDDLFLTDDAENIFADIKDLAKEHLKYLDSIEIDEEYGFMSRDTETGKPKFNKTDKFPITHFPVEEKDDKDAPIIIWDHPLPGQEFGVLHVGGSDPYNQDESVTSSSIGTLYIFRRTYDPMMGRFQQHFVACYAARPKDIKKWRLQVRLLLEYYGATVLPENEEPGFIRYFDDLHLSYYVEDGLDLAKEINPKTQVKRRKGLSASIPNIRYGNGLLKTYFTEDLILGQDANGDNIIKPGIIRIKDKMLLREVIAFKKVNGKWINVDRIVGARHALINAGMKDKLFPIAKVSPPIEKEKPRQIIVRSPFGNLTPGVKRKYKRTKLPFKIRH